jgi:hypothetical protein
MLYRKSPVSGKFFHENVLASARGDPTSGRATLTSALGVQGSSERCCKEVGKEGNQVIGNKARGHLSNISARAERLGLA